jgi:hypothetical protein
MSLIRYAKKYFFTRSSSEDRFLEGNVPNESVYRQLFNSIPFVKERSDRAKFYGEKDPQGLVVKNTSEHVKKRKNPTDLDCENLPFSYAVDAENLPSVETEDTFSSIQDADLLGMKRVEGLEVKEDNAKLQKSTVWKIKLSVKFLNLLVEKFSSIVKRLVKLENQTFVPYPPPNNVQFGINGNYNIRHLKNSPHLYIDKTNTGDIPGIMHRFRLSDPLISYLSENIPYNTEETTRNEIEGVFVREVENKVPKAAVSEFLRVSSKPKRYVRCPSASNVTKVRTVSLGTEYPVDDREILMTQFSKFMEIGTQAEFVSLGEAARYVQLGKQSQGVVMGTMDQLNVCAFRANLQSVFCETAGARTPCGSFPAPLANNLVSFNVVFDLGQNPKLEVIFTKTVDGVVRLFRSRIQMSPAEQLA